MLAYLVLKFTKLHNLGLSLMHRVNLSVCETLEATL